MLTKDRVVNLCLQVLDEALMRYYTNNPSYQIHVTNHPTPISDATKVSKTPYPYLYCYRHSFISRSDGVCSIHTVLYCMYSQYIQYCEDRIETGAGV